MAKATISSYEHYLKQYELPAIEMSMSEAASGANAGHVFARAFVKELGEILEKGSAREKAEGRGSSTDTQ